MHLFARLVACVEWVCCVIVYFILKKVCSLSVQHRETDRRKVNIRFVWLQVQCIWATNICRVALLQFGERPVPATAASMDSSFVTEVLPHTPPEVLFASSPMESACWETRERLIEFPLLTLFYILFVPYWICCDSLIFISFFPYWIFFVNLILVMFAPYWISFVNLTFILIETDFSKISVAKSQFIDEFMISIHRLWKQREIVTLWLY